MIGFGKARYDVTDKVVLVTGGGQGIGLATAEILADRGAKIALLDVNQQTLDAAVAKLGSDTALGIVGDVRDADGMQTAVDKIVAHFGRLDVVVANAGVSPPTATLRLVDREAYDRVIAINLGGTWNTIRASIEQIIANQGHVVIVSSCAAFAPGMGGAAYMVSKAAVEQLGRALRIELAIHGATAGVTYFGIVDTDMAHGTLDDDPLGEDIGHMLPWPLSHRISAETAGKNIADGIANRSARTMAPGVWAPYSLARGAFNVFLDRRLVGDKKLHALLRRIEDRG